jgi:hypothetical protein
MILAVLLALQAPDPVATTVQEPMPQVADVQYALASHWVMISSSGLMFHDYAVRNLTCTTIPLTLPNQATPNNNDLFSSMSDQAVSKAHCQFEYAVHTKYWKKSKKVRFGRNLNSKPLSKHQLNRISAKKWNVGNYDLVLMTRTACRYMGRTPDPDECNSYWVIPT